MRARENGWFCLALIALLGVAAAPAQAQGKSKAKHYAVSGDKAVSVSRRVDPARISRRASGAGGAHSGHLLPAGQ